MTPDVRLVAGRIPCSTEAARDLGWDEAGQAAAVATRDAAADAMRQLIDQLIAEATR